MASWEFSHSMHTMCRYYGSLLLLPLIRKGILCFVFLHKNTILNIRPRGLNENRRTVVYELWLCFEGLQKLFLFVECSIIAKRGSKVFSVHILPWQMGEESDCVGMNFNFCLKIFFLSKEIRFSYRASKNLFVVVLLLSALSSERGCIV